MMQLFSIPGAGRIVNAASSFVRYEAPSAAGVIAGADLSVRLRGDGSDFGQILPGDSIELPAIVSTWEFTPADPVNDGALVRVGVGRVISTRTTVNGSIALEASPRTSALVHATKTVTTASAQVLAASANRKYLLVQNKSGTGTVWLVFGAAATQAAGIKLGPGGNYEMASVVSTQALFAIGDIASNADVLVVEG